MEENRTDLTPENTNTEETQNTAAELSIADKILAEHAAAQEAAPAEEPAALPTEAEASAPVAQTPAEAEVPAAVEGVAHVALEESFALPVETSTEGEEAEAAALVEAEVDLELDLSGKDKKVLATLLETYVGMETSAKVDTAIRKLREAFESLDEAERRLALDKWLAENDGDEEGFDFKPDGTTVKFNNILRQYRERRRAEAHAAEKQKETNQARKLELLEQLRVLVDEGDVVKDMEKLRKIETEWKSIGAVPATFAQEIWNNYAALRNRFYDRRSIHFELADLDRKKNLEAKLEYITKAKALLEEPSMNKAVDELNKLHEDWRSTGPVPRERQEELWQEFKAVSDQIYGRRREFVAKMRTEQEENLRRKQLLIEKAQLLANFQSQKFEDWNEHSQQVVALEAEWKTVGPVTGEKASEINKAFWGYVKQFFGNKSAFFKARDKEKADNLAAKTRLCEQAEELQESTDWDGVTNELKRLQEEWKKVGPVPIRQKESIYKRFKAATDKFFERKREQFKAQDKEQEDNLAAKRAILKALTEKADAKDVTAEYLQEQLDAYQGIGFVPFKTMEGLAKDLVRAVDKVLDALKDSMTAADLIKLRVAINGKLMGGGRGGANRGGGGNRGDRRGGPRQDEGNGTLRGMERTLRNRIGDLENQIHSYENNLSFFGNSRNVESLRKEVEGKIKLLQKDMTELKEQLKLVQQGIAEEQKSAQQGA